MSKKYRRNSTCGICGESGHKSSTCQKVKSIILKWEKFVNVEDFIKDQYLLSPIENTSKSTKVGGKRETLRFGKCQGWYSLESDAGVHYIGLVGEVSSQTKNQSKNSFYERWLGHYTDSRRSWHDKGGFGQGKNGTWPSGHLKDGKLLSKNKYQLLISKVNNMASVYDETRKRNPKPKFIVPGIEQAALITNVEQYMIHHYANNPVTRKFNKDTPSVLVDSKGTKVSFKPDEEILFNTSNTLNIIKTPPNIRVSISPKTGKNKSHLCELNDEERTMKDYKKTYKEDTKKPAVAEKAPPKKAPAKKAPAKKATNSKKKNLTKVQTFRLAQNQKTWSWKGNGMGKVADYAISKRERVVKK